MADKIFPILLAYMAVAGADAFILYGVDKYKAKHGKWRIPEKELLLAAFLGGALGALLGMLVFRHKIRKRRFCILVPAALVMWIVLLSFCAL